VHQDDEKREREATNKQTNQPEYQKENCCYNQSQHHHQVLLQRREEKRREERDEKNEKNKKRKKNSYLGFVRENECSNGFCKNLAPGLLKIFKKKPISIPWSSHEHQPPFDFFLLHPAAVDCTHGYSACLCGDEDDDDNDAAVCVLAGLRD
jgi:hypothetical protein